MDGRRRAASHGGAEQNPAYRPTRPPRLAPLLPPDVQQDMLRKSDVIARIGVDEICVPVSEPDGGLSVLRKPVFDAVETFNRTHDRPYRLSTSVGLPRVWPADTGTLEQLLVGVDELMYEEEPPSAESLKN